MGWTDPFADDLPVEEIRKEDENVTENEKKDQENKVHGEWEKSCGLFHREKLVAAGYYI